MNKNVLSIAAMTALLAVSGCATMSIAPDKCPEGTQKLENCPPLEAINDPEVDRWFKYRTWMPASQLDIDPIQLGIEAEIPVQSARAKLIGSTDMEALQSLAAKIRMIDRAEHSVDAVYYIFKADLAGVSMLGALCNAVQRGVDVRLMVDSIGSMSLDKGWLQALDSCEQDAGFIRNADGELTTNRARVQILIFNALSKVFTNPNRRSHDKLLVIDGFLEDRAIVMTGGRNMSLDYYGILSDGSPNPDTYFDSELLMRPSLTAVDDENTVAEVSEVYFTLLSIYKNNKMLKAKLLANGQDLYLRQRKSFDVALEKLYSLPRMQPVFAGIDEYLDEGYHETYVRLAHEFANLVNKNVVSKAVENLENNPNSIMNILKQADEGDEKHVRIVSPYLFAAQYYDGAGNVIYDEAQRVLDWLAEDEERVYEIITNSVLTSDNFFAQSIVDMNMAPRLLLDEETRAWWLRTLADSELNPELVDSDTWKRLVSNPRLRIYETGRSDDVYLGGDAAYGKLHAKYIYSDHLGFLGTANFDYRSRLFNNEMGFFFIGDELSAEMDANFEYLKSRSYIWGSPEWLNMRRELMKTTGGQKGVSTRNQRKLYKTLKNTGLDWQF